MCKSSSRVDEPSSPTATLWSAGRGCRAFTTVELLVVLGIVIILLSIFIPYALSIRETSRRSVCATNLVIIRSALQNYARDYDWDFPRVRYDAESNPDGYVAFTGPDADDPFAPDSPVQPNDVTASLWLLVRIGYIPDPRVFVCPSAGGSRDWMTNAQGEHVARTKRGNFRRPENLSYSYASPFSSAPGYRLRPDVVLSDFALLADQNPGSSAADVSGDWSVIKLARANSPNHGKAGQNVVYGDSSVRFQQTPYCGVGYSSPPGDNIYTARAASPSTQPTTVPFYVAGFVGQNRAPISLDDTYLVPTAEDSQFKAATVPVQSPATTEANQ